MDQTKVKDLIDEALALNESLYLVDLSISENNKIQVVVDGDKVALFDDEITLKVMETPGHTLDHIVYYGHDWLFCGDTLFSAGCGRLFEGTAEQMWESLQKLMALPDNTALFCAHEYTLNNLQFAQTLEPENTDIQKAIFESKPEICTLPSTIGREKHINPYFRTHKLAFTPKEQFKSNFHAFKKAGYPIAHLDNTNTKKERELILKWFNKTPNAIITSVSILTTGFDEPTIEAIILNRATKSLTLYYQMIGRGSRVLNNKSTFDVVDLGNNFHRFGPWGADLDWQKMFRAPDYYLNAILSDEEIESTFRYELPADVKKEFAKSTDTYFDMKKVYIDTIRAGESSKRVLEKSIVHHAKMCIENSEDVFDALILAKMLGEEVDDRINRYAKCISKSTHNFVTWLKDDYRKKLNAYLRANFDEDYEEIHGHPPIEE